MKTLSSLTAGDVPILGDVMIREHPIAHVDHGMLPMVFSGDICNYCVADTTRLKFMCSVPAALAAVWWCMTVELLGAPWPLEIQECAKGKASKARRVCTWPLGHRPNRFSSRIEGPSSAKFRRHLRDQLKILETELETYYITTLSHRKPSTPFTAWIPWWFLHVVWRFLRCRRWFCRPNLFGGRTSTTRRPIQCGALQLSVMRMRELTIL
ncbi:hypothetical protein C8R47DRAFT_1101313 [Mycena vitilis]|nr:hypothetical protein C8R47DRAFT_1101313 [Mycena vitilis]